MSATEATPATPRFAAIEGLRAWLAWTVVLGHCIQGADLQQRSLLFKVSQAGAVSVFVFIIISGFVITHLVLEKKESYAPYLVRRWMRIFPLFAVASVLAAFTLPLYADAMLAVPWHSTTADLVRDLMAAQAAHPWAHLIAHATMLHGAIPDNILKSSQHTCLPAAWSLSLEWQFYLIAPFAIMLARKPRSAALLLLACWIGANLFFRGWLGEFHSISFLPGAAPGFAIGIASRLTWPMLQGRISHPLLIALGALSLSPLASTEIVPFLIWVAFFAFLCGAKEASAMQIFDLAFKHKIARYWGRPILFSLSDAHDRIKLGGLCFSLANTHAMASFLAATRRRFCWDRPSLDCHVCDSGAAGHYGGASTSCDLARQIRHTSRHAGDRPAYRHMQ